MRAFYHLLINTTFASIINFTVWFAITFFTYLETHSVFATGTISGIYLVLTAVSGLWFGSLVDHHKKKTVMLLSSVASLIVYVFCLVLYLITPEAAFRDITYPILWIFILLLLIGVIIGNIRTIALPTAVSFLVPSDRHDKANGLIGTTSGIGFLLTSVISGYLVGRSGMFDVLLLSVFGTLVSLLHLVFVQIPEKRLVHLEDTPRKIDVKGTIAAISLIPGLFALIIFNCINNFLGGVFMALMDAYGLSLVSVQVWGLLWGGLSTAFIIGGLLIAKFGLGKNPVRLLFLANLLIWSVSSVFTLYPSIYLLVGGMFIYLVVVPFIEASEQTIIQKVVPKERQGRVFGFAQSVEQSASPLTAFLIGPLTQFFFIPFMTTGYGAQTIGQWFGTGDARGIALVFTLTGIIGFIITFFAMRSRFYHQLSLSYLKQ